MKRSFITTLLLLLIACPFSLSAQEKKDVKQDVKKDKKPAGPILPDKNLEAAVRAQVFEKRNNTQPLNEADLKKVFVLHGNKKGIKSLKGLENCTNLLEIQLANNDIVDIGSLKQLTKVQSLDLAGNKIKDVAPLAKLTKLQYLKLSGNEIENIEALAGLTKLASLYLSDNKLKDIGAVAKLTKLASLYLDGNQISDIGPLTKVNRLMSLDLSHNQIANVAALGTQTQTTFLMLEHNKIADLGPLVALCQKDAKGDQRFAPFLRLYLEGNPLSDAAKSKQIAALKGIGVRVNLKRSSRGPGEKGKRRWGR